MMLDPGLRRGDGVALVAFVLVPVAPVALVAFVLVPVAPVALLAS
jgi:hypothetical protein